MSKTLKIILSIIGISILGFVIFIGIILNNIFGVDKMCGSNLVESKLSPNGKLKVLVFSVNCGAISDFATQISIVESDYKLRDNDVGNILSADSDHGIAKMNESREIIELKTKWLNNQAIEIEYPENARIFNSEENRDGVKIIYKKIKS